MAHDKHPHAEIKLQAQTTETMFCTGQVNTVGRPGSPFICDTLPHAHISPAASQTANMNPLMINVSEWVTNQPVYTSSEEN